MDLQQQPNNRHRQRDSRKKQILIPNLTTDHRRSMTNQTPNQDWHILGLGFLHNSRVPSASQETVWKVEVMMAAAQCLVPKKCCHKLIKSPDSSNINRCAAQSWSKLASLLKDN